MSKAYRYVKLLKNHLYPTYQLHAFMANDKTRPQDGLRLAALTTMGWLKSRLGEASPQEWRSIPSPEEYLSASDSDLPSVYVNQGHVINIVSLPEKGMWSMQITEPDLGSDPGNPAQARQAVPGRIIETNISFLITGKQLECGFKTVISDPIDTVPEAEVYRITVVRLLMENPAFGLKQVTDIPMKPDRLSNGSQIRTMLWLTHHPESQLPAVIFTQLAEERQTAPVLPDPSLLLAGGRSAPAIPLPGMKEWTLPEGRSGPAMGERTEIVISEPPYDLDQFAYYTFSHCRTYVLEHTANRPFTAQSGIDFKPGDVIVLYPTALGGGERVIPYHAADTKRDEAIRAIEKGVKDLFKTRSVDYGRIMFLSGVREQLLRMSDELMEDAEAADAHFRAEIEQLTAYWKNEVSEKEKAIAASAEQLKRQKEYASRLEEEKGQLREALSMEQEKRKTDHDTYREEIAFWRRRYDQPKSYDGIAAWVEEHFSDRLVLHPKAVARMLNRSNQCAAVELVCDALDYLATDYWEMRYLQIPKEAALTRCARKYGRPFEVKPTGQITIEYTPGEYKIKYFRNAQGAETDSDLDYHLRVGNDPENLLRIYFLHDDREKKIVIGSLPDHLRAIKVQ